MTVDILSDLIVKDYNLLLTFFEVAFPFALIIMIIQKCTDFFFNLVSGKEVKIK